MSVPLTPTAALRALRRAGLRPQLHPGWDTHTRTDPARGRPFGDVHGVILHHTASHLRATDDEVVEYCRTGTPELPGPLTPLVVDREARLHLIGWGRTNHAGEGDPAVFAAVMNESYGYHPPKPTRDAIDGNTHFYGIELVHSGHPAEPWSTTQVNVAVRAAGALCRAHKWTGRSVIGHREWTTRKPDPADLSMVRVRAHVDEQLAAA